MTSSFKKTNNKESTRVKQLVGRRVPDSTQSPETIRGSCREKHTEKFQVEDGKGASVSEEAGRQQTPESTEAGDGVRQVTEEAL